MRDGHAPGRPHFSGSVVCTRHRRHSAQLAASLAQPKSTLDLVKYSATAKETIRNRESATNARIDQRVNRGMA
jgi:hypothetical protein